MTRAERFLQQKVRRFREGADRSLKALKQANHDLMLALVAAEDLEDELNKMEKGE